MRTHYTCLLTIAISVFVISSVNGQNVGIETPSPDSTLSIKNKVEIGGSQGDIVFTDDEGSITFPVTTAPNSAMIHMFSSGFANADRMVVAHSPAYPDWGIQYRDDDDEIHFVASGNSGVAIDLLGRRMSIGSQGISDLFTLNVQSSTEDRTAYFYNSKSTGNSTYGIYAGAFGTGIGDKRAGAFDAFGGSGTNIGVRATAGGGQENVAVYGSASGTAAKAAHFPSGEVIVGDRIGIGIDDANNSAAVHIVDDNILFTGSSVFVDFKPESETSVNGLRFYNNDLFQGAMFYQPDDDLLNITSFNNVPMLVADFGSNAVGIGTYDIAAGYKLSVDGKIISEELRIQNSSIWPDYVFEDTYSLMSLEDLETSIRTNKHLPNVPSAETVEEEGIMVGDMQRITMEKVEELTLYIIQVHKENKELKAELEKLKTELDQLKGQ